MRRNWRTYSSLQHATGFESFQKIFLKVQWD